MQKEKTEPFKSRASILMQLKKGKKKSLSAPLSCLPQEYSL